MALDELKEALVTNDIAFNYNGRDYVICPLDKFYAGEAGNPDDDNSFDTFEEMAEKWLIEGSPLNAIVGKIELL